MGVLLSASLGGIQRQCWAGFCCVGRFLEGQVFLESTRKVVALSGLLGALRVCTYRRILVYVLFFRL